MLPLLLLILHYFTSIVFTDTTAINIIIGPYTNYATNTIIPIFTNTIPFITSATVINMTDITSAISITTAISF